MAPKLISWPPNRRLATVLRNSSAIAWFLCVILATRFIGSTEPSVEIRGELILFVGVFPFFFGVTAILQKRMTGVKRKDWVPILFRSTPKAFTLFYRAYFFAAWSICAYPVIRRIADKPEWPTFGISDQVSFLLIPSVFYLTCVGGYWSVAAESNDARQTR